MAIKRVCSWNPGGEVRDAAKHPTMHRTAPQQGWSDPDARSTRDADPCASVAEEPALSKGPHAGVQMSPLSFPLKHSNSPSLIKLVGRMSTSFSLPHCFVSPQSWLHDQRGWPCLCEEGQFFVWVREPLKIVSYKCHFLKFPFLSS